MATGGIHKWTPEQTRRLIQFRAEKEKEFTKKKYAAKQMWETLIKELGLEGIVTYQQMAKKWENLKKKYKDLKTPKTGSGTDSGEVTAATWQFYAEMHAVLGARPSIEPPVLVASAPTDATTLLLTIIEPNPEADDSSSEQWTASTSSTSQAAAASTSSTSQAAAASTSSTSQAAAASTSSTSQAAAASTSSTSQAASIRPDPDADPTTPSPPKKKKKSNPVLAFLKEESKNEQKRHEETQATNERFLDLFAQLVEKQ